MHKAHDVGVSKNIGKDSDAIEAAPGLRWLRVGSLGAHAGIRCRRLGLV